MGDMVTPGAGERNGGAPPGHAAAARPDAATPDAAGRPAPPPMRREVLFGDRVVRCFPGRPRSVHAMLEHAVGRFPEREALVCGDLRMTWRQVDDACGRLAAALAARGIGAGARVVLLLSNRPEFVIAWYALLRLGAVAVPVSVREQAPGLAYIAAQSGACAIVHDDALADRVPDASAAPALRLRLPASALAGLAAQAAGPLRAAAPVHEEDTAAILYTSGTTGRPKGAMLAHVNIVHSAMHFAWAMSLDERDRSAMAVPASHVTGLVAMIATMLHVGGALVVVPEFKAGPFLALAARERITHTILVPAMYALCLLQPDLDTHDLSAWRIGAYGGAPMPRATIEALAARLPRMTLMNAYGSTETTSPATAMPRGEQAAHLESVGVALPAVDLVVVDGDGREVPPGEPGELLIGGPMVVRGYWDNPEATAAGFVGGCWRSGDLGSVDADGFVRIHDRIKDMINRGGHKIWSVEVENTLVGFPGVVEAAAVGVPCPVLGERVHAFVHLDAASTTAARAASDPAALQAEMRAHCARRLADYKVPESIGVRADPLPRNANGKLLKREMRGWIAPAG